MADDGVGTAPELLETTTGTGLKRLRDRLAVLYGGAARLDVVTQRTGGFRATLTLPFAQLDE